MPFEEINTWWPARLDVRSEVNINMVDGYATAARLLVDAVRNKETLSDELVYPIIFLLRQHLELKLKVIHSALWKLGKLERDFPRIHDLEKLWTPCELKIQEIQALDSEGCQKVRKCLEAIGKVDPHADSFRFAQRKKDGSRIGDDLPMVDIVSSFEKIHVVSQLLEGVMLVVLDDLERSRTHS